MSSSAGVVTLLFTDLVASTELLARVGDDAAEELRRVHFGLLRNAISTGGGQEVKTLGDGLMVAFTSSLQAIRSAVAIQQATEEHNGRTPELLGARLARLEAQLVFAGLQQRFARLESAGEPRRRPGLALRGLESLPLRVTLR